MMEGKREGTKERVSMGGKSMANLEPFLVINDDDLFANCVFLYTHVVISEKTKMGLCASLPEDKKAEFQRNKEISAQMKKQFQQEHMVTKLLLLGAGESGKSTVFKQMKQLYTAGGWSASELAAKKADVYNNVVDSMQTLIKETLEPTMDGIEPLQYDADVMSKAEEIRRLGSSVVVDEALGAAIKAVWNHPSTQSTYGRRSDFQLNDNTEYYLNSIDRIAGQGYTPTLDDVLHVRIRTSGIVEAEFSINGNPFRMFDVGGQRNERKKWIHCFDNVTAVIYVVSLNGFDQVCYEDNTQNRLVESLELFASTRNSKWFKKTPFILFLNKMDLFEEKIKKIDLRNIDRKWFLEYNGGREYRTALEFIKSEFSSKTPPGQELYAHETTATDTKNVNHVFNACKDIFLRQNLQDAGFLDM